MIRILMLSALIALGGCASTPKEPCQPWQPCWKKLQKAYYLHQKCEIAKADARKRHRTSSYFMEIYITEGNKRIRCQ